MGGDKSVAIRDLSTSRVFTERTLNIGRVLSYRLLIEIWTVGFISSMLVLEWEWIEPESTNPHNLLVSALNEMDQLELMEASSEEEELWIKDKIRLFKNRKLFMNKILQALVKPNLN